MIHFDPSISLGNLITIALFIFGAVKGYQRIVLKVEEHDTWIKKHEKQSDTDKTLLTEVRENLAFIKGRLAQPLRGA